VIHFTCHLSLATFDGTSKQDNRKAGEEKEIPLTSTPGRGFNLLAFWLLGSPSGKSSRADFQWDG